MASTIRAEWYDLPSPGEADFLDWLHGEHLPRLAEQPGVGWVGHYRIAEKPREPATGAARIRQETTEAVPHGSGFVLLTSARADLLLNSNSALAALDHSPRLGFRENWREAVFIEEARIDGPCARSQDRNQMAPRAMQLGNFVTSSVTMERVLANYYRQHRFIQVEHTRGCIGARKYVSTVGWPRHGILYEFVDMDPDEVLFEARMNSALPDLRWSGPHPLDYVIHAPHAPHAGRRIWPPVA